MITQVTLLNPTELKKDLEEAKQATRSGITNAFRRYGLFIEAHAVQHVPVASGLTRQKIHAEEPEYDPLTETTSVRVVADSAHSIFVEEGFQGHFVPFAVSESLYRQALNQWGWRVPTRDQLPDKLRPGAKYLIPRGRKHAVAGVMVSGKAQPFMKPALEALTPSLRTQIMGEELRAAYRKIEK